MGDWPMEDVTSEELPAGIRLFMLVTLGLAMAGGLASAIGYVLDSVVLGAGGLALFGVTIPLFVVGSIRVSRSRGLSAGATASRALKDLGRFLFWFMPP